MQPLSDHSHLPKHIQEIHIVLGILLDKPSTGLLRHQVLLLPAQQRLMEREIAQLTDLRRPHLQAPIHDPLDHLQDLLLPQRQMQPRQLNVDMLRPASLLKLIHDLELKQREQSLVDILQVLDGTLEERHHLLDFHSLDLEFLEQAFELEVGAATQRHSWALAFDLDRREDGLLGVRELEFRDVASGELGEALFWFRG